jgi:hypothetical protein
LAPEVGLEPTTNRLTADRSTTELLRNVMSQYPTTLLSFKQVLHLQVLPDANHLPGRKLRFRAGILRILVNHYPIMYFVRWQVVTITRFSIPARQIHFVCHCMNRFSLVFYLWYENFDR